MTERETEKMEAPQGWEWREEEGISYLAADGLGELGMIAPDEDGTWFLPGASPDFQGPYTLTEAIEFAEAHRI